MNCLVLICLDQKRISYWGKFLRGMLLLDLGAVSGSWVVWAYFGGVSLKFGCFFVLSFIGDWLGWLQVTLVSVLKVIFLVFRFSGGLGSNQSVCHIHFSRRTGCNQRFCQIIVYDLNFNWSFSLNVHRNFNFLSTKESILACRVTFFLLLFKRGVAQRQERRVLLISRFI